MGLKGKLNVWRTMPIIIFLVLITAANAASSYLLGKRDRDLIKIAFMNGFSHVMALEMKQLQALKRNPAGFKRLADEAATRYIRQVELLNLTDGRAVVVSGASRYRTDYLP